MDGYIYSVEWKYDVRSPQNDVCIITKIPKTAIISEYDVEQVSSTTGFAHHYFETLAEALSKSILKPDYCTYVGVDKEEIAEAKKSLERSAL